MTIRGRPPKYRDASEMQGIIDAYFDSCKGEPLMLNGEPYFDKQGNPVMINSRPPTVTGLALALGFTSRQALLNYQAKASFVDTVMRAKMRVEEYCEQRLFDREGQRGAEFSLRSNFRWLVDNKERETEKDGSGVVLIPEVGSGNG